MCTSQLPVQPQITIVKALQTLAVKGLKYAPKNKTQIANELELKHEVQNFAQTNVFLKLTGTYFHLIYLHHS